MATTFKTLQPEDSIVVKNNLHEQIPITGTIISGTYSDNNIKNYSHGMFQSVYDYPYLSSSANHIFDLSLGVCSGSELSSSSTTQIAQKQQMYNELALVLVGADPTGSIRKFDEDGKLDAGAKLENCYFINFARLLTKDEVMKGTFSMVLGVNPTGSSGSNTNHTVTVSDVSGSNAYKVNSPSGEYNILYATSSNAPGTTIADSATGFPCGLIYYQAGIAVLTSSLFKVAASGGLLVNSLVDGSVGESGKIIMNGNSGSYGVDDALVSGSISGSADGLRRRVQSITFNNTTALNSTIYMCRAGANDFNYSSNPTYLSSSKMRVKNTRADEPVSYITTVGLYSPENELLAVAKVSEPLKKTPSNEFTLRCRLDY